MGAFTAPLVLVIQAFALLAPIDRPHPPKMAVNPWLEFHASMSIVAYGAFALACIAGLMYLLQERQLKTHQLHSVFSHLPPLIELYAAIVRLLWVGLALYTAGLGERLFHGRTAPAHQDGVRDRGLVLLFRHPAGPPSSSASRPGTWPRSASSLLARRSPFSGASPSSPNAARPDFFRMQLFCIGLSHHTANVETRERYARLGELDARLRETTGCAEVLLLSTCNRVEVYGVAEGTIDNQTIARCLRATPLLDETDDAAAFYRHEGEACVQHLFRVASGLDSMVVGETEVLGQTKQAYEAARHSGGAGPYLHRLFQRAFRVAKQVRTHTEITRGAVSVGSVAVELAGKIFGELKQRKVLVLGAGETSEKTARALASRGVTDLRVSNRSPERAALLAQSVGGRAVPFVGWEHQCREIDILISSTSANEPLLTRETLAPILHVRWDRPLFIIDIAVPRDVAPDVNEMEGVFLYDIDSLQSLAEQSRAQRRQQVAAAEEIIGQHVRDFATWLRGCAPGIAWARRGRASRGFGGHVRCALRSCEAHHPRDARERSGANADGDGGSGVARERAGVGDRDRDHPHERG